MNVTPGGAREQEMSTQLLADPLVFIRRWIGEVKLIVIIIIIKRLIEKMQNNNPLMLSGHLSQSLDKSISNTLDISKFISNY